MLRNVSLFERRLLFMWRSEFERAMSVLRNPAALN
jgi:hypothetical protein